MGASDKVVVERSQLVALCPRWDAVREPLAAQDGGGDKEDRRLDLVQHRVRILVHHLQSTAHRSTMFRDAPYTVICTRMHCA